MMAAHLSDDEKDRIQQTAEAVAKFEAGDRVTMEPTDYDFAYAGDEYEGVLLTVDSVFYYARDLSHNPERTKQVSPDYYEAERVVTLDNGDDVYLGSIQYRFREHDFTLGETGLIAWDDYRAEHDTIRLYTDGDHESVFIEPAEEPCPTCGCNRIRRSVWDNGFERAGRETCPACGEVHAEHGP